MRKGGFTGTAEVFRFTPWQYMKSKSTIVSMIVMLLVSMISLLIASVCMPHGVVRETQVNVIAIANEAGIVLQEEDV